MAHVWAARALLPEMLDRGEGYLFNTASAAGLLTQVSSLVYSVTKHAAVALAEWMAIEYGDARRARLVHLPAGRAHADARTRRWRSRRGAAALIAGGLIEPEDVAEAVVAGIREERLLILPARERRGVHGAARASDPERWLRGMRRIVRDARGAASA